MGRAKDEGAEQLFVFARFSKYKCLKLCFKTSTEGDSLMFSGNRFQAVGPATENERFPNLVDRCGSTSWWWTAERSEDRPGKVATRTQKSAMYDGARPFIALNTSWQHLYCTCSRTCSQCSLSRSRGVTWSFFLRRYESRSTVEDGLDPF